MNNSQHEVSEVLSAEFRAGLKRVHNPAADHPPKQHQCPLRQPWRRAEASAPAAPANT